MYSVDAWFLSLFTDGNQVLEEVFLSFISRQGTRYNLKGRLFSDLEVLLKDGLPATPVLKLNEIFRC